MKMATVTKLAVSISCVYSQVLWLLSTVTIKSQEKKLPQIKILKFLVSDHLKSDRSDILIQAISGENFSQSEYVDVGASFNFLFRRWRKALHCKLHYGNLSNMCSKQAFRSMNLSNVCLFTASYNQFESIYLLVLKLFQSLEKALTHTPLRALIEIAWTHSSHF